MQDFGHLGYIMSIAFGAAVVWLVQRFLKKTVGTEYVKRSDFKKFQETHDARCHNCQNRAAVNQIKGLLIELAIKAGVPAHEVAKIANVGNGNH